ncbi:unnamed protein product [Urochloa humidicola]
MAAVWELELELELEQKPAAAGAWWGCVAVMRARRSQRACTVAPTARSFAPGATPLRTALGHATPHLALRCLRARPRGYHVPRQRRM